MKFVVGTLLLLAVWQINAETVAEELVRLTNEYRATNSLPAIPMSYQLTKVAIIHTHDMATGGAIGGDCNLHSWSNNGYGLWNGCCYTSNHTFAQCMWDKPREISMGSFTGNGYENAAVGTTTATAALNAWKGSPAHNDVILNQNTWTQLTWKSLGASVCGSYAVLWFSDTADNSGGDTSTLTCESVSLPSPPGTPIDTPVAQSTPTSDNTPVDSNAPSSDATPTGSTSPSTSNTPSSAGSPNSPNGSKTPSNNISKPSSAISNTITIGLSVGMAVVSLL